MTVCQSRDIDCLFESEISSLELREEMYSLGIYFLGNRNDAEDLIQDALTKAIRKKDNYNPEKGNVRGWVMTIFYRIALDKIRKRGKERKRAINYTDYVKGDPDKDYQFPLEEMVKTKSDHIKDITDRDEVRKVRDEIERAPELYRGILLCVYSGMNENERMIYLDIPRGTAKSRLNAARRYLIEKFNSPEQQF